MHTSAGMAGMMAKGQRFRSYLSRDNGMHGGTAVADHEDKLGIWKEIENVGSHLQGEGILVA